MSNVKNEIESHNHSKEVLDLLLEFDSFMDSLTVIADLGAGSGLDINWFAKLMTRDDPPMPHDYECYAVDINISRLVNLPENVTVIQKDFEEKLDLPSTIDLLWCHDAFQYATNPLRTLKLWNEQMSVNGMLALSFPQSSGYRYNRLVNRAHDGCYYNHNVCNLIYMLAVNGFDCKDLYMKKDTNSPWLYLVVYKTDIAPMDPKTTRWTDLADKGLLHESIVKSLNKHGHVRQEDIIMLWLNKDWTFCKD